MTTQQLTKHDGNKNMRAFFSDLATLRLSACSRGTPGCVSEATSLPAGDLISGISSITSPATALKATNYSSVPHNALPANEVDEAMGNNMFSMAHRTAPGSTGHTWFLQVGFKYLPDTDS